MVARHRRRTLVAAGAGAVGTLLAGSYAWTQYRTRETVELYPLEVRNDSDRPIELEVTVADAAGHREGADTVRLDPGEGRDISGPWMKHAGEWRLDAASEDHDLELTAGEITNRLEGSGWGTDRARVVVVVTADGDLDERIEPSDV